MMKDYKPLGEYIRQVDVRNKDRRVERLVGVSVNKTFIPSVANTIGTDLSSYKIIRAGQFACSLMQVSRDEKIPVAMYKGDDAIMSPAYPIFEIIDKDVLMPEYLDMWVSRAEFDREASYYAVGGVRGSLTWEDFCDMRLPVPPLSEQRRIVERYASVSRRIACLRRLIATLEETARTIYRHTFVDGIDKEQLPEGWRMGTIGGFCVNTMSGGTPSRSNVSYWNSKDYRWLKTGEVSNNVINDTEEYISKCGLENSSAKLIKKGAVVMAMYGATAGQVAYLNCETTTNQACCNMLTSSFEKASFLYYHCRFNQEEISRLANGGAQANLSQQIICQLPIIEASQNEYRPFAAIMKSVISYYKEISCLTSLQSLFLTRISQ